MKKIIIGAALVCAATFVQAAAVDWSANGVVDAVATAERTDGKSTPANGWLGYMILAADYAQVTADLQAGKTSSLEAAAVGPVKISSDKGKFSAGTATGNVASGEQTFYFIVLNSGTLSGATSYFSASATETVDASLDTVVNFGSMATASKSTDAWTAIAAPEPTSGLLLLLGVAGLALKRKRA